jgi:tetrahydromethanopterin S-methyltransferase subunit B
MDDKEVERMINAAGLIGAVFGFVSGAGLMALVGIIF